jgi:hypothetical protein
MLSFGPDNMLLPDSIRYVRDVVIPAQLPPGVKGGMLQGSQPCSSDLICGTGLSLRLAQAGHLHPVHKQLLGALVQCGNDLHIQTCTCYVKLCRHDSANRVVGSWGLLTCLRVIMVPQGS